MKGANKAVAKPAKTPAQIDAKAHFKGEDAKDNPFARVDLARYEIDGDDDQWAGAMETDAGAGGTVTLKSTDPSKHLPKAATDPNLSDRKDNKKGGKKGGGKKRKTIS